MVPIEIQNVPLIILTVRDNLDNSVRIESCRAAMFDSKQIETNNVVRKVVLRRGKNSVNVLEPKQGQSKAQQKTGG